MDYKAKSTGSDGKEVAIKLDGLKIFLERVGEERVDALSLGDDALKNLILNKGDKIIYDSLWDGTKMKIFTTVVPEDGKRFTDYIDVQ